ncbi:MAG: hypothetical protein AB3N18_01555, partial [Allomuricauda sp.]
MKVNKLTLVLFLVCISAISYFIEGTVVKGVFPFNFAQTINIFLVFLIFCITLFSLLQRPKIVDFIPINIFIVLILFLFSVGILFNSPIEIMPSFLRFSMYFMVALLAYNYVLYNGIRSFSKKMKAFTKALFFIAVFFGFYEVLFLDIRFMNGAY